MREIGKTRSTESGISRVMWLIIAAVVAVAATVGIVKFKGSHKASALESIAEGDFLDARLVLDRVLAADPADMEALYYRGLCFQQQRDTDAAIQDYERTRSDEKWWPFSFYRSIEALLVDARVNEAKAEIESLDPLLENSSLAQEAIGKFHYWECERGIKRCHQLLAPSIGDRPADRMRNYIRRVVMADSKIYAASLDRMLRTLKRDYEFSKEAVLTTIIERAHDSLVAASIAFKKACAISADDPLQSAVLTSHQTLADIYEIRRRNSEFEKHLQAIISIEKEDLQGEIRRVFYLRGRKTDARLRLAESRLEAKQYEDVIEIIEPVKLGSKGHRPYAFEKILAQAHRGMGNEEKALEIADYWLKVQPKFPTINFIKGSYHFNNNDYDAAYPYLEIAVGRQYRDREFVPTYVQCLLKLGKFDRANTVLDKVLAARPNDWSAAILKIKALEGLGWIDDARTSINKMLGGRFSEPGSEANKAMRKFNQEFIARNNLLPKTLNAAQVLYEEDKNDFDFGRRYLDLMLKAGGVEKARTLAHDLFKRCPPTDRARFNVMMSTGQAFESLGFHELAIRSFKEAIKNRPYEVAAHVGVSRNDVILGRIGAATRALDHATALNPDLPELHRIRFDILLSENRVIEALKEAQSWVAKGGRDRATLQKIADILLSQGQLKPAKQTIALIEALGTDSNDESVALAMLQVRAGLDNKATTTLDSVVRTRSFGLTHRTELCHKLAKIGRHDLIIRYLSQPVFDDNEVSSDAVAVLAAAYRASNDNENFLNLLARLRRRGRSSESFVWAAEFCDARGAATEVLSITEASISERASTPELLELGIRTALKNDRKKLANSFLQELKRLEPLPPGLFRRMQALIKAGNGDFVEAAKILQKTLPMVGANSRRAVWTQLIELLAEKRQFAEMKIAVSEAIKREEVEGEYSAHVARLLVEAADDSAGDAIRAAIAVAPQAADAWYDAGMVALSQENYDYATKAITKSWELRPDPLSTYALSILAAVNDDKRLIRKVLRKKGGQTPVYVLPESPLMNQFISSLMESKIKDAQVFAAQLSYPSAAEREALGSLIAIAAEDSKTQIEFTKQLARFFIFAGGKHTLRYAALAAESLEESRPSRRREVRLMRARALMGSASTFYEGIKIVGRVLDEANNADEAALSIYAQTYIKSRQTGNLDTLVRVVLQQAGFSDRFKMDLAKTLTNANFFEHAARILHTCQVDSIERTRQEARALYKSGHVDRAAELLISKIKTEDRGFDFCQIVGAHWVSKPSTWRRGYELLRNAVYRYGAEDDEVYLTFAKEAYRNNQTEEARKNMTQYLSAQPASARRVNAAIDSISSSEDPDLQMSTRLYDRRLLLDPQGYFDSK